MKLRNKLILSCAALAAVATTAVSTTFAWYTQNSTVHALNATGVSMDSGNSSIFISGDHEHWWSKVDTTSDIETQRFTVSETELVPVSFDGTNWVDEKGATTTKSAVTFTLYFKTQDADADVNIAISTLTVANTTESVKTKTNYLTGADYFQDFREALAFTVEGTGVATGDGAISKAHGYSLTPDAGLVTSGGNGVYTAPTNGNTPANAHDYVNAVSGDGTVTYTASTVTDLEADTILATLPASGAYKAITFNVYLDGADPDCNDACQGQSFDIDISFSIVE